MSHMDHHTLDTVLECIKCKKSVSPLPQLLVTRVGVELTHRVTPRHVDPEIRNHEVNPEDGNLVDYEELRKGGN